MNTATIDLDEPTTEDLIFVKDLIKQFVEETGSVYGQSILDNWQQTHSKLIKVFPKDYKRVLQELEKAKEKQSVTSPVKNDEGDHNARNTLQVNFSFIII